MSELPNVGGHWLLGPGRSASECESGQFCRCARSRGRSPTMGCALSGEHVFHEGLPVGVDRRAHGAVAHVIPYRGPVVAGGHGVVVVAEELGGQAVGAGRTAVTDRAPEQRRPGADRTCGRRSPRRAARPRARDGPTWCRCATGRARRCRPATRPCRPARSRSPGSSPGRVAVVGIDRRRVRVAAIGRAHHERPLVVGAGPVIRPGDEYLVGGVVTRRRAVGDVDAREGVRACTGDAVDREPALRRVELSDAGQRLNDGARTLEVGAAVERAGLEEHAFTGSDVGADPHDVHHALLSVRMAQPWRPPVWPLLVAGDQLTGRQVSPPSVERANSTGSDPAVPRNATLHT